MRRSRSERDTAELYVRLCRWLVRAGHRIGVSGDVERTRASKSRLRITPFLRQSVLASSSNTSQRAYEALRRDLALSGIVLKPEEVLAASKTLFALLGTGLLVGTGLVAYATSPEYLAAAVPITLAAPLLAKKTMISFPSKAAARRAERVLRSSAEATNLMIMSLRHEPSISKAITIGSSRTGDFSAELKRCTWGVIMGRFAGFEEAILSLGDRWAGYSEELKASLNSMVTASRESTQEGRRRALDRANQSMVNGAKRRIEEYALSLSTPSMLIFSLGILLPLMVGSFLPMLSWNLWSMDEVQTGPEMPGGAKSATEMVFMMNVLFPTVAILVAMSALTNHPFEVGEARENRAVGFLGLGVVVGATCIFTMMVWFLLDGILRPIGWLLSGTLPLSLWLVSYGRRSRETGRGLSDGLEDALFKSGARMLEGENFESALNRAGADLRGGSAETVRRLCLQSTFPGEIPKETSDIGNPSFGERNALQGLRIAKDAASKDELAAGVLAMDLSCYLRDLRELERTLTMRLKPTISMMKTTALALAPIVLGVTYAIYLSLGSMIDRQSGASDTELFFLVLGLFLAQMNAVVVYFVWGIEGKRGLGSLALTLGTCMIISELIYTATAVIASR